MLQPDYSRPDFRTKPPRRHHKPIAIAAAAVVAVVAAILARPSEAIDHTSADPVSLIQPKALLAPADTAELVLPLDAMVDATPESQPTNWTEISVASGQSLSAIFDDQGLPATDWMALVKLDEASGRLTRLRVGDEMRLQIEDERLAALELPLDEVRTLAIKRTPDGFEETVVEADVEVRQQFAMGTIDSSLFLAGNSAGLSDGLIMDLAHIFGYDIDFALDIRRGDRFIVVYEELFRDGEKLRDGNILAAEFVNQTRTLRAIRHVKADGNASYFDASGRSLKKAFIRTPLDIFRISSHFNPNRRHPVLNTIRAHRGTDYAASSGTPIKATGDGKIVHRGNKGGYGRAIIIRHGTKYRTLYAHMSRFRGGLHVGSRVQQGQIIGYVGSSGLASGPHLHYEFLVNGVHRNPVNVKLPHAEPIDRREMPRFKQAIEPLVAQLDVLSATQLARVD